MRTNIQAGALRGVLLMLLSLAAAGSAHAALIAYEGFDYAPGGLGNGAGGVGWSSTWYGSDSITGDPAGTARLQVGTGSMPVPGGSFAPTGGRAFAPTEFGLATSWRRLATPIDMAADQSYYISFLLRRDTDPGATFNNLDAYLSLFRAGSGVLDEAFRVGGGSNTGPDNFQLIGTTGVAGDPTAAALAGDFRNDTSYFAIVRIDAHSAAADAASLAVYPGLDGVAPLTEPAGTAADPWLIGPNGEAASPVWTGAQSIDRIRVTGNAAFSIDEIRIGTTWADVTGAVPSPTTGVPEPSTLALLGLALAGAVFRHRARVA